MRDMLAGGLILLPGLQPGLPERLALLFALDELGYRLAQHPMRGSVLCIRQPLEAVPGILIKFHGNGADGVHAGDSERVFTGITFSMSEAIAEVTNQEMHFECPPPVKPS